VAHDLLSGAVKDCNLALEDRDEWIAAVAYAVEDVADARAALLTDVGERRQLGRGKRRACWSCHKLSLPV
jgi:hypothetical protein